MIPMAAERSPGPFGVTTTLVALIAVAHLGLFFSHWPLDAIARTFGVVPARFFSSEAVRILEPLEQFGPLLTYGFVHDGWLHFSINIWFLWVFGRAVETRLHSFGFTVLYFGAAITAGIGHLWGHGNSFLPMVGSSGAIAGIMGAFLVLEPRARIKTVLFLPLPFLFKVRAYAYMGLWLLLNVGLVLLNPPQYSENAWDAHLAGFGFGVLGASAVRIYQASSVRRRVHLAALQSKDGANHEA